MSFVAPLQLSGSIALVILLVASGAGCAAAESRRLSQELDAILDAGGIEAMETRYRQLRRSGFAGAGESRVDTNALGHQLLRQGRTEAAVRVFRLNTETHPGSANAFDSLAEAYLAAGDRVRAAAAYRQALTLDPRHRGARYGLARLAGRMLPPVPMLVLLHILAGTVSLLAGAVAMLAPKGRPVHRAAGRIFMFAMLAMAASAVVRAARHPETEALNFWMGSLTLYLVASGWRAARQRRFGTTAWDRALPAMALVVAGGLLTTGWRGAEFAGAAVVFGAIATLAAIADVRWLRRSSPGHADRLLRHLWRVGLAMFIAVGSLFLGQPQVFPYELRGSGLLAVPPLLVIVAFAGWFVRHRFGHPTVARS